MGGDVDEAGLGRLYPLLLRQVLDSADGRSPQFGQRAETGDIPFGKGAGLPAVDAKGSQRLSRYDEGNTERGAHPLRKACFLPNLLGLKGLLSLHSLLGQPLCR